MIRKFNSFNEAQFDKTAALNSTPIINTTIKYSKEILDYLKGSIEDIENSIYDCENGAIDETELKSRMRHILEDNIEEEVQDYSHEYFKH